MMSHVVTSDKSNDKRIYSITEKTGDNERNPVKPFLTVPEAAKTLGITERAAWQRIYRGQLPHKRWGRRVMISVDELHELLAALPGISVQEAVTAIEKSRGVVQIKGE